MKWVLTGARQLERQPSAMAAAVPDGWTTLRVCYCGICRTDAKMWHAGHRDLVLPRVPGHEVVARDAGGRYWAVWPGIACGLCRHCRAGRENRCETVRIMGFHFDGGFSHHLSAPVAALVPLPAGLPPHLGTLAEPAGCAINALEGIRLQSGERLAIFGGGSLGLMTALAARAMGADPLIIETDPAKRRQAAPLMKTARITGRPAPPPALFDTAINACPDPLAFHQALAILENGGRLAFFSGLAAHPPPDIAALNQAHYRELTLTGAYGLTRRHMQAALDLIARNPAPWVHLVTAVRAPETLPQLLPTVLEGRTFRHILDFTGA